MDLICGAGLKSKQKVADYTHDAQATLIPVASSCQASCSWSLQGSHLGKTGGEFSPLVGCIAPFHVAKISQLGGSFWVTMRLASPLFLLSGMCCL